MDQTRCLIFDLYGTLLKFDQGPFLRALAKSLHVNARLLTRKVFLDYMTASFPNEEDMIVDLMRSMDQPVTKEAIHQCMAIIDHHIASVTLVEGARNILSFLKARGYRLGLISNAISPFKHPFYSAKLDEFFDEAFFSCDVGLTKPDIRIYRTMLDKLGLSPSECVFVGDSWKNDHLVPVSMGMKSLFLGRTDKPYGIKNIGELGWRSLDTGKRLLNEGDDITFDGKRFRLDHIEPIPEHESGKYNIVAKVSMKHLGNGSTTTAYVKRFSLPGSATVEKLAYDIYALIGASSCISDIADLGEPILMTTEIIGDPWNDRYVDSLVWQIGFHLAAAYIFSYADFRPRNIILRKDPNGGVELNVMDMELCFFGMVIDLHDLKDALSPSTFNVMAKDDLESRITKNVVSTKHCRRLRRTFISQFDTQSQENFTQGWMAAYDRVRKNLDKIEENLRKSLDHAPYPVIGTHGHRRAMSNIDIDEIVSRANRPPMEMLDVLIQ
jgi:FMN phosphatase YigB (HAD superfamily)